MTTSNDNDLCQYPMPGDNNFRTHSPVGYDYSSGNTINSCDRDTSGDFTVAVPIDTFSGKKVQDLNLNWAVTAAFVAAHGTPNVVWQGCNSDGYYFQDACIQKWDQTCQTMCCDPNAADMSHYTDRTLGTPAQNCIANNDAFTSQLDTFKCAPDWYPFSTVCKDAPSTSYYCNSDAGIDDNRCLDVCLKYHTSNDISQYPKWCDSFRAKFCAKNQKNTGSVTLPSGESYSYADLCSCSLKPSMTLRDACLWTDCVNSDVKWLDTEDMSLLSTSGCGQICAQIISGGGSTVNIDKNTFQITCHQDLPSTPSPSSPSTPSSPSSPSSPPTPSAPSPPSTPSPPPAGPTINQQIHNFFNNTNWYSTTTGMLLIAIVSVTFLGLIALVIYLIRSSSSSSSSPSSPYPMYPQQMQQMQQMSEMPQMQQMQPM